MSITFITKYIKLSNNGKYPEDIRDKLCPIEKLPLQSGLQVKVLCDDCKKVCKVRYYNISNKNYYKCKQCANSIPWNKGKKGLQISWNKGVKGGTSWNKGKIGCFSEDSIKKMSESHLLTLKEFCRRHQLVCKIEELEENPDTGEIFGRCKNHKCPNSKENNGWFVLTRSQLSYRTREIERGNDGSYLYCSEQCKQECILYRKKPSQLIKEVEIASGIRKEDYTPTSAEYEIFRQEVLKRDNYQCVYCEDSAEHVHHIRPKKIDPFYILDPDWAISVCKECHYKYGHRDECSTGVLANILCR